MDTSQDGFEIDYVHVGEEASGGDAICLRYGNLNGLRNQQTVVVIDGGTLDSGEKIVSHIKNYYRTDEVDFVVSTHQDSDHISGLKVVLNKLKANILLMHIPWEHEAEVNSLFKAGFTDAEVAKELQKSLENVRDLEEIAIENGVAIVEPFTGAKSTDGSLHVLGPTKDFYESLVPNFRGTPEAKSQIISSLENILGKVNETAASVIETLDPSTETLTDEGRFTPENESSVIILLTVDDKKILFTGDAGITALTMAADYADSKNLPLNNLHLLHVPHHGSKQNVGPTILNRIKASKSQISAPLKGAPKHPSQRVINALLRRDSRVWITKGGVICHSYNSPSRNGWGPVQEEIFVGKVDD